MVLSETRGLQLHGVMRGGLEWAMRLVPASREPRLTVRRRLTPEPERQRNRGLDLVERPGPAANSGTTLKRLVVSDILR